ncbi:MAG: hypothetical protein KDK34_09765 [Leptospiraceae bacterium]|nr:hypothetical protein [Leptospiraceae bacterium]
MDDSTTNAADRNLIGRSGRAFFGRGSLEDFKGMLNDLRFNNLLVRLAVHLREVLNHNFQDSPEEVDRANAFWSHRYDGADELVSFMPDDNDGGALLLQLLHADRDDFFEREFELILRAFILPHIISTQADNESVWPYLDVCLTHIDPFINSKIELHERTARLTQSLISHVKADDQFTARESAELRNLWADFLKLQRNAFFSRMIANLCEIWIARTEYRTVLASEKNLSATYARFAILLEETIARAIYRQCLIAWGDLSELQRESLLKCIGLVESKT